MLHSFDGWTAESEGFEPPDPLRSTVFKTAAIDHSANSPRQKYNFFSLAPHSAKIFLFPPFIQDFIIPLQRENILLFIS